MQYFAEGAHLHSLTSNHCAFFFVRMVLVLIFSIFIFILDLAERLRNLTAIHAQVTGLSTFLELSYWQYQSQLIGFAKDLQMLEQRYSRADNYWVLSGLCSELKEAELLFETVDTYLAAIKDSGPEDISDLVYSLHGRFLNILSHLHGEDPREWPTLPPAPTFASKNTAFRGMSVSSADPVLALHPKLGAGLASTVPIQKKKGKGKAREKTPLFLPESQSLSPSVPFPAGPAEQSAPDVSMEQYINFEGDAVEEGEEEESSEDADGEYVPPGAV